MTDTHVQRLSGYKLLASALLALLALVATLGTVTADAGHGDEKQPATGASAEMEAQFPPEMDLGQRTTLEVRLHGSGAVPGAEVVFVSPVRFAGTEGEAVLGRAVTDAEGMARLTYLPRREGETTIIARFAGNGQYGATEVSGQTVVRPGGPQYTPRAGVRVPGINVGLLAAVLGAVWATYLMVMGLVWRIARRGHQLAATPPEGGRP